MELNAAPGPGRRISSLHVLRTGLDSSVQDVRHSRQIGRDVNLEHDLAMQDMM
jgi:hypothetical protein